MTAQSAIFRTVFLEVGASQTSDAASPRRLLEQMGHDVSTASSPEAAIDQLMSERPDLFVVDGGNVETLRSVLDSLATVPESQQPRQVAVFAETVDESLRSLRRRISPQRVHVLLKPLHVHGLLNVIKQMEAETEYEAAM